MGKLTKKLIKEKDELDKLIEEIVEKGLPIIKKVKKEPKKIDWEKAEKDLKIYKNF